MVGHLILFGTCMIRGYSFLPCPFKVCSISTPSVVARKVRTFVKCCSCPLLVNERGLSPCAGNSSDRVLVVDVENQPRFQSFSLDRQGTLPVDAERLRVRAMPEPLAGEPGWADSGLLEGSLLDDTLTANDPCPDGESLQSSTKGEDGSSSATPRRVLLQCEPPPRPACMAQITKGAAGASPMNRQWRRGLQGQRRLCLSNLCSLPNCRLQFVAPLQWDYWQHSAVLKKCMGTAQVRFLQNFSESCIRSCEGWESNLIECHFIVPVLMGR